MNNTKIMDTLKKYAEDKYSGAASVDVRKNRFGTWEIEVDLFGDESFIQIHSFEVRNGTDLRYVGCVEFDYYG